MDNRIQISKSFTMYDVQFDETAFRLGIENIVPNQDYADNAALLAENVLEPLWAELGPQYITSWYRCENLEREYSRKAFAMWCIENKKPIREQQWQEYLAMKQHYTAQAVCLRGNNDGIFEFIKSLKDFDVLQHKEHWISVSCTLSNRKRVIEK